MDKETFFKILLATSLTLIIFRSCGPASQQELEKMESEAERTSEYYSR